MKKIISLVLVTLMTVSLFSCTGSPDKTGKLEKITVVLDWTPNTNHTGLYVAKELGYYEEMGYDVSIIQPPEDGAVSLVASQKADFGVSFQEEVGVAIASKSPVPVVGIASIIDHNVSGIISLKEKNIKSPKDLESKTYASWDSPFEKAVLSQVMKNDGGDFNKVNAIPNTVTDVISALKTDVEAVWIYYSWDGIATELAGLDCNYFAFKDIDPVLDFYTPILVTSEKLLKDDPDKVEKFLKATQKGYEYAISKPKESADILIKNAPEIDSELAQKSMEYLATQYKAEKPNWGVIDEKRWNAFYRWFYENGLVDKPIEGKGFVNILK